MCFLFSCHILQLWFILFYIFKFFIKVLTVVIHSSHKISDHFYEYYFELFVREVAYLLFLLALFLRFGLIPSLKHIPPSLHFA